MSRRGLKLWIDDNPARKTTAAEIGVTFENVRNGDVTSAVDALLQSADKPALVILDHIFDKTKSSSRMFVRGSTIAEAIKERWPDCPVIGVTAADRVVTINARTRRAYDDLFSFSDLKDHLGLITSITRGFSQIGKTRIRSAASLVTLLKPPEDETERLLSSLPDDLKERYNDSSVASRLYSWIKRLYRRPGFLYDHLWASTYLGLNEDGFNRLQNLFDRAQYGGVFKRPDDLRWWSSELATVLFKKCKTAPDAMSWEAGRGLPGIKQQHHSKCYKCGEPYPETVAFLDEASDERRQMHLRCTVPHPNFRRALFFEDIRMMQGK